MKHLLDRLPLLAAIATAFVIGALPAGAAARQMSPLPVPTSNVQQAAPLDGDLTWELAGRGIFLDERVRIAFVLLVDEAAVMTAAGLDGQPLLYGDPQLRAVVASTPPEDAELLLAASGITMPGEPMRLQQSRVCQIWTPPDDGSVAERQAVVTALAAELVRVFANLGVTLDPCEAAASAADADLVVSEVGLDSGLPALYDPNLDGFLAQPVPVSPQPPGGTGGGPPAPRPAAGGNAGLFTSGDASNGIPAAIGVLLTTALVLLGRSAVDRSFRRT